LENKLLLNPSKTEVMLCGTQVQCNKVNTSGGVEVAGTAVKFGDFIKLLNNSKHETEKQSWSRN